MAVEKYLGQSAPLEPKAEAHNTIEQQQRNRHVTNITWPTYQPPPPHPQLARSTTTGATAITTGNVPDSNGPRSVFRSREPLSRIDSGDHAGYCCESCSASSICQPCIYLRPLKLKLRSMASLCRALATSGAPGASHNKL